MLPLTFYARDAQTVARALLGQTLVCKVGSVQRARVVETEAYVGVHDLACHASKGRTKRTETMFGPPGRLYVYLIYGMYSMLNVVTGAEGEAQAVLVRAAEPLENVAGKTDGPGKLTRALGVTRDHNAHPLDRGPLYFEAGPPPERIITTTRVGIPYAGEWRDAPLRFYDAESPHVSKR